ncbi:MAG TPA: 2,3-bisphosphoglycerate-independent phosphoglycerate mutase [Thermoleophilaceae bacterium]|nr:2,3-bisphosphoglycerate-independent phosphoglycerate mutase [Thermoleophilaceae bacterium]
MTVPAVCLVILDGWGLAPPGPGNAVSLADTPVFDGLWERHRHTQLTACGRAVGLPDGQMGNSEVGHLNLGAGKIVRQDLARIDDAVAGGEFAENPALRDACAAARESGRLHLLGLVSDGGVHASMDHLRALIELAASFGVPDLILHAFTDGRDTLPDSGAGYLATVEGWLAEHGGRVATVSGRYYAMDRDRRWPRVKLAYDAIVHGRPAGLGNDPDDFPGAEGGSSVSTEAAATTPHTASAVAAVSAAYARGETDEFVRPTLVGEEGRVRDGDAVICFNFRPDRARELTRALVEPGFAEFDRGAAPRVHYTTLTEYQEDWRYPVAFPPERPDATLASVLADRGVRQLHVAETEKYPHVTYFFNGGEEHPYAGEEHCLVDSPRDVPTYDHKPEMSAEAAASALVERWNAGGYGFGIINFANPDMVGHTGSIPAAVAAIEAVDVQLGRIVEAVHGSGGACIVTADHGNADHMLEPDGSPNTAHSLNPVPLIVTADVPGLRDGGILADVAPTVLELLGVAQPAEMTGKSLLVGPQT